MDPDILTEYQSEVVGFNSSSQLGSDVIVVNKLTSTDAMPPLVNQTTETNDLKDVGIQTEGCSIKLQQCDDHQLAAWLKKIYPLVEKELLEGPTSQLNSDVFSYATPGDTINVSAHQIVSTNNVMDANNVTVPRTGFAAWMSITTQNAPLLAIFDCAHHSSWCDHTDAEIHIFQPIRNTSNGVQFEKSQALSVMSCISSLCTNPFNKDMLAGGTFSGNIVVWQYDRSHVDGTVKEHSSETSQFGKVVGLGWMPVNASRNEWTLLSAHVDGTVVCWKVSSNKTIQDKMFAIKSKQRKLNDLSRLSALTVLSESEFVVGTEDGLVLLCSYNPAASGNPNNLLDPVVSELQPHPFAVRSFHHHKFENGKRMSLISCDESGEVLLRKFSEDFLNQHDVIKLPVKLRGSIVCTKDSKFLLTPVDDGAMEVISLTGQIGSRTVLGHCNGHGNTITLSDNNCWVVIGSYNNGTFQLFSIDTSN